MQSGGREGPLLPVGAGVLSLGSPQLDWQPGSLYSSVSLARSEERRVGKEGRSRWSPYH